MKTIKTKAEFVMFSEPLPYGHAVKPDLKVFEQYFDKIAHNRLSNFGPLYQKLRDRLVDYLEVSEDKELVLCSSGHVALMAAYAVSGVHSLLMPSFTFESTRCAATLQHILVWTADVDKKTGSLTTDDIYSTIADGIAVVCPLSSIPDLESFEKACKKINKPLIIDGAATFGTPGVCNYGDFFCMSFHGTKTFPIGEGGAVICSKENAVKIKEFLNFGFNQEKIPSMIGLNGKISEYSCAIGLSIFEQVLHEVEHKLEVAAVYKKHLSQISLESVNDSTVFQGYPIFTPVAPLLREKLSALGVETQQYYRPLVSLPTGDLLYETNICLPCHSGVSIDKADKLAQTILEVHNGKENTQ
jgi:dTDP-4-amino-4,6-dideoxygalactose transaminase